MSRISQAVKSILYGVSTDNRRLRDKRYLAEQINMQTVEGSGLHKRPPAELIAAGLMTNYVNDGTHHTIIKSFLIGDATFYFTLKSLVADKNATKTVVIYDSAGVAQSSTIDTIGYYAGITLKSELDIKTQQDTVFVTNRTKTTAMLSTTRTTDKHSLIHVKEAPADSSTLTISFVDTTSTTFSVRLTVGVALSTRGTNVVAADIRSAINNAGATGITADSRGSVVSIKRTDNVYAQVAVEDQNAGNVLVAINGEISTILDLPKYIVGDQILKVKPAQNTDDGTFYLQSNEVTTGTIPTTPAPNTVLTAGVYTATSPVNNAYGDSTAFVIGSHTPVVTLGGVTVDDIYFINNINGTGRNEFRINPNSGAFPVGSLSRCTVIDNVTSAVIFDGNVTEQVVSGGVWYATNVTATTLVNGRTYNIYFDQTFALSTDLLAVSWEETSAPAEEYLLDSTTMPQTVTLSAPTTVDIENTVWDERAAGDDNTNPQPSFIGKAIKTLAIFQNRLVAVQDDIVETTETDNTRSWWRNTVTQLLVTHPVRMRSTSPDSDTLHSALNHNRDLLLFSKKSQFKLAGEIPLTPGAGLPQTGEYTNNPVVEPASIGKNVFFSFNYGVYGGISKYKASSDENAQDRADPITDHVKKYMRGSPSQILGDANLGILYLIQDNKIYVCDYNPREKIRAADERWAWSEWLNFQGETTVNIADATLIGNKLQLVLTHGTTGADILQLDVVQDPVADTLDTYLDYRVEATATSGTFAIPAGYPITDPNFIIVYGAGDAQEGNLVEYTESGGTITITSEFEASTEVVYGVKFKCSIVPSTLYIRDESGHVNPYTRLHILKWLLHVTNSADISAEIVSPYYTFTDQYWSGLIAGDINSLTDSVADNTGTFDIGYQQQSDLADLRIHSTGHLPLNITGLDYLGSYSSRGKRF